MQLDLFQLTSLNHSTALPSLDLKRHRCVYLDGVHRPKSKLLRVKTALQRAQLSTGVLRDIGHYSLLIGKDEEKKKP